MSVVIENPVTVAELQRRAAASGKTVDEIVAEALHLQPAERTGPLSEAQREKAIQALRELQFWYQAHRDPHDTRTDDEVIGYNEHGSFD